MSTIYKSPDKTMSWLLKLFSDTGKAEPSISSEQIENETNRTKPKNLFLSEKHSKQIQKNSQKTKPSVINKLVLFTEWPPN